MQHGHAHEYHMHGGLHSLRVDRLVPSVGGQVMIYTHSPPGLGRTGHPRRRIDCGPPSWRWPGATGQPSVRRSAHEAHRGRPGVHMHALRLFIPRNSKRRLERCPEGGRKRGRTIWLVPAVRPTPTRFSICNSTRDLAMCTLPLFRRSSLLLLEIPLPRP